MRRSSILLLAAPALAFLGVGCSLLAGVDFDEAHPAYDTSDANVASEASAMDAADAPGRDAAPATSCPSGEKLCNGLCVKPKPENGCGATLCAPCSLPHTAETTCDSRLRCASVRCEEGWGNCDNVASDGCETDLRTDLTDCGVCDRRCSTTAIANADTACTLGVCVNTCKAGFADCATPSAPQVCAALPTWFQDADGDGFGGAATARACAAPQGYVVRGGDCHDGNSNVFPGQPLYFGVPYTTLTNGTSFDYDCNGAESLPPGTLGFTSCPLAPCVGEGYASTLRTGVGLNPYCGSTTYRTCVLTTSCNATTTTPGTTALCH